MKHKGLSNSDPVFLMGVGHKLEHSLDNVAIQSDCST